MNTVTHAPTQTGTMDGADPRSTGPHSAEAELERMRGQLEGRDRRIAELMLDVERARSRAELRRWLRLLWDRLVHLPRDLGRRLRGKKVPRPGAPPGMGGYARWIATQEALSPEEDAFLRGRALELAAYEGPLLSVVMPVFNTPLPYLRAAVESVQRQTYPKWELCIADDASTKPEVRGFLAAVAEADQRIRVVYRERNGHISAASNSALEVATGTHVVLLDHDDELAPTALYWVAEAIRRKPDAAILFSDEDKIRPDGTRTGPYFKCAFNYDLFLAHNMVSHLGVYRTALVREIGGFREGYEGSQDYDLALRAMERVSPSQIVHIPRVLYHWRVLEGSTALTLEAKPYALDAAKRAIADHLERRGVRADVLGAPECAGWQRIRYHLPGDPPRVLVVIPTRDRLDLLRPCIASIRERSTYRNYRICVVDNGSVEPETRAYLSELAEAGHLVLRDDSPFNYPRLNNRAVERFGGDAELVCLLNNDIEVLSPDWLEELVGHALQPGVGCVGARLWYPDGRLQHAGVILGMLGAAGHAHQLLPRGAPGYLGRAVLQQSMSAVTAACLVVSRAIYEEVGGLDERLAVAFNDVDFCLKVRAAGYRNVWTPYAELVHHESASRGSDERPEQHARFVAEVAEVRRRWGALMDDDPCYSPHLALDRTDVVLAGVSRISRIRAP